MSERDKEGENEDACKGAYTLFTGQREREKEGHSQKEGKRERERKRKRGRKREYLFLKGMTGAMAHLSYLFLHV